MEKTLSGFVKKNIIFVVAFILALLSSLFYRPSLKYIDFRTVSNLFCILAVVKALDNIHFFSILANKLVSLFKNTKMCIFALVYITFISSMFIANDMALITFLPLSYFIFRNFKEKKYMLLSFIFQNIAANLGGMLTPFGNPQNLYLYNKFNIDTFEFLGIMLVPFLLSISLITLCCMFIKSKPLEIKYESETLDYKKLSIYIILFVLSVIVIFRFIPYQIALIIVPIVLFICDKSSLKKVDYLLLGTFISFFIFAGNVSQSEIVKTFVSNLLSENTFLFSICSCQFISNVPSAILLSQFTQNYSDLLVGVNIGGIGTLIASLASLITFKEYIKHNPGKSWHYIKIYSLINFSFLFILGISIYMFNSMLQ